MATKLKLGTDNNWATKKGNLLAYNDENDNFKPIPFDVTRASTATRLNKAGLIETVEQDRPRVEFDNNNGYVLLEPTRTNYATNNSSMDTYGTVGGSSPSPTLTADYTTAPDGTNTATRLQATVTGSNYSLIQFPSTSLGDGTYYISVYAKSNTGSNQTISFYGNSSPTNAHTVTPEWTRIIVEATRGAGITKYAFLGTWASQHGSDASIDISLWGAQIEVDSSYATSLIPTSGSAVTRTNDNVYNGGDSTLFDLDELTFFVDVTPYKGGVFHYVSLNDGSNQNRIIFIFNDNNTNYTARVVSSGSTQLNDTESITFETRNKIAIALKTNDTKVFLNGTEVSADATFTMPVNLDRLNFSIYANSNNFFQGKVHQVMVFNKRLTDAELTTLTI